MALLSFPDSLWAKTANETADISPLAGDVKVDVAIIGAGFTGLRAALVLAEAGVRVVVMEAGEVGWGASGRNGGQVNPMGHEPPDVVSRRWDEQYGGDFAERYVNMTIRSADELFDLVK